MTTRYSKEQVIMRVTRLTRPQLDRYITMQLMQPERSEGEAVFCDVDIARLELLCDLSEDLDLDETAMGIVLSLLDQLHEARRELVQLAEMIESLPKDLRRRLDSAMRRD